jgi:hypothetical protein
VYKNTPKEEMKIAKDIGPPYFLFDTKKFDQCFYLTSKVILGHNRSKTVGENTRRNAHPFLFDNILGMHNGTVNFENKNRMVNGSDFKTDSEAIMNNIQVLGIKDTINKLEASEAYAFVWYDSRDGTLNFLRNKERPLWYVMCNEGRTLFWASEWEILLATLIRHGIQKEEKAHAVDEDIHMKWVISNEEKDLLPEPVKEKYENHKPVYLPRADNFWKDNKNYHTKPAWEWDEVTGELIENEVDLLPGISNVSYLMPQTKIKESKVPKHDPHSAMKRQRLDRLTKDGLTTVGAKCPLIYDSPDMVVHRDSSTQQWITLRWNKDMWTWDKYLSYSAPIDLPFSILDVNGNHKFKHQGKKKNKKIYYKGYNGTLLLMDKFNEIMAQGCASCDRKPEWGNEVIFLSKEHVFLCEYCAKDTVLVTDLKEKKEAVN